VTALPLLLAVALCADASPQPAAPAPATGAAATGAAATGAAAAGATARQARSESSRKTGKKGKAEAIPPAAPPPAVPEAAAPAPEPGPASEEGHLLVEHKCGKCHNVSLALTSELSDANWKLHMKRMANRPGAAITDDQARKIHDYLKSNGGRSASR